MDISVESANSYCLVVAQIVPTLLIAVFVMDRRTPLSDIVDPAKARLELEEARDEVTRGLESARRSRDELISKTQALMEDLQEKVSAIDDELSEHLSARRRRDLRTARAELGGISREVSDVPEERIKSYESLRDSGNKMIAAREKLVRVLETAQARYTRALTQSILSGFIVETVCLLGGLSRSAPKLTMAVWVATIGVLFILMNLAVYSAQKILRDHEWRFPISSDGLLSYSLYIVFSAITVVVVLFVKVSTGH